MRSGAQGGCPSGRGCGGRWESGVVGGGGGRCVGRRWGLAQRGEREGRRRGEEEGRRYGRWMFGIVGEWPGTQRSSAWPLCVRLFPLPLPSLQSIPLIPSLSLPPSSSPPSSPPSLPRPSVRPTSHRDNVEPPPDDLVLIQAVHLGRPRLRRPRPPVHLLPGLLPRRRRQRGQRR